MPLPRTSLFRSSIFALASLLVFSACGRDELYLVDELRFKIDFEKQTLTADFDLAGDLGTFKLEEKSFEELGAISLRDRGERDAIQIQIALSTATRSMEWPAIDFKNLLNLDPLPSRFDGTSLSRWPSATHSGELALLFNRHDRLQFGLEWKDSVFSRLYKNYVGEQKFKDSGNTKFASLLLIGPTEKTSAGLTILCDFGESPFDGESLKGTMEWTLRPLSQSRSSWSWIPSSWLKEIQARW